MTLQTFSSTLSRSFSHIYVESRAKTYCDTRLVLDRFPKAKIVEIDDYRHVFNRPRQDWRLQKRSLKLILAVKKDDFLYSGSSIAPDFGHQNFFYNALMLNCLYDCEYCYLQGMYPSANIVMFVNGDDYFEATTQKLAELGELYLCISYDTDLLAFEDILPQASRWVEFARNSPGLTIELRTKSVHYQALQKISPPNNVILAWTLSPNGIAKRYEHKTPSLAARIASLQQAIDDGWNVRLCFDPLLAVQNWKDEYRQMIDEVFEKVSVEKLTEISLGVFRMGSDYFRRTKKKKPDSVLMYGPYEKRSGIVSYSPDLEEEIINYVRNLLVDNGAEDRVVVR